MQSEVNYALDLPNENVSWNWKASMPLIITSVESFTCGSCEEHYFLFNAHNAQLTRKPQPSLDPMRAFNEMFQFISASRGFRQSSMTSSSLSWNCHIAIRISPINSTKPKPIPRPVRIGSKKKFAIQTELAFIKKLSAIINRSWIQVEQSMALRAFRYICDSFPSRYLLNEFSRNSLNHYERSCSKVSVASQVVTKTKLRHNQESKVY